MLTWSGAITSLLLNVLADIHLGTKTGNGGGCWPPNPNLWASTYSEMWACSMLMNINTVLYEQETVDCPWDQVWPSPCWIFGFILSQACARTKWMLEGEAWRISRWTSFEKVRPKHRLFLLGAETFVGVHRSRNWVISYRIFQLSKYLSRMLVC